MKKTTKPPAATGGCSAPPACSPPRRPPCALMTASAAMHADCAALKRLTEAGMEVVVVQDADFEASLKIVEKVRRQTLKAFKGVANAVLRGECPGKNT